MPVGEQFGSLILNIAGSAVVGIAGGLILSYGCGCLNMKRWIVLLVAAETFLSGICESFHISYMITFLIIGVTITQ
ncbi:MAG: hypothetical protein CMM01_20665 [Rhodopirellula sp.]|nr:hypothetical protein [Rhodopirellula sp.]MAI73297.1 hypothetical protein [Rhodopirellula sp.]OUX50370.1 MAG: hypothetical protein CBE43_06570 [Rhodopirellula sp. TMED283]